MKTFHLTTPHMHSTDVKHLQVALHKAGWYKGSTTGVYDVLTAQAVFRAKYWLGYKKPDHVAGDKFYHYLIGRKKANLAMHLRRAERMKPKHQTKPMREKALANAIGRLGQKESPPNSNRVSWASVWYGIIGPWCAMAVTRWYVSAGSKAFKKGHDYSFVPYITADARAGRNNLTVTLEPQPGDVVCYAWGGPHSNPNGDHTGLFEGWINKKAGTFHAIEGNTAVGNDSDGGEVMRRERSTSNVVCFVHVGK